MALISSTLSFLLLLLLAGAAAAVRGAGPPSVFVLDVHHRFSEQVRRWSESTGVRDVWPEKGSLHYYTSLVEHDRALLQHRRGLAGEAADVLTFSDGNSTFRLNRLGFLHYALVSVGTPSKSFLVALDTGSNLFWIPCDCQSCAPTKSEELNVTFNKYNSISSSTSKPVPCSSSKCSATAQASSLCASTSNPCPYTVEYLTPNLSTSGVLLEDVLHMVSDEVQSTPVETTVTFGCGQVQTGAFLRNAAPNGLLGLGRGNLSVPSTLASDGLTADSFSMCFSPDGIGRIRFGDVDGGVDRMQSTTPFVPNRLQAYVVNFTGIEVNDRMLDEEDFAIVDSGSSFTILTDQLYTNLSEAFDAEVKYPRHPSISDFPFQYCYTISSTASSVETDAVVNVPNITLVMKGGNKYPILDPAIYVVTQENALVFCLGIMKSDSVNIIGQNFMTGLRLVFDREQFVLGWNEFNCYDDVAYVSTTTNSSVTPSPESGASAPSSPTASDGSPTTETTARPVPGEAAALPTSRAPASIMQGSGFVVFLLLQLPLILYFIS